MASENAVKNVALVGGTGRVGSSILAALLAAQRFSVTAITRAESDAAFPAPVKVAKGNYDDDAFFESALAGQDALVITLGFTVAPTLQTRMIAAAIRAKVPWIVPNEFGSDNAHPRMRDDIVINAAKTQYRAQVEQSGTSSWIGIVNNPWFDYSLETGNLGIDVHGRRATLYDDGTTKFNTTTLATVGRAVAGLLALPAAELARYKNQFAYVSSFLVSQREILDAVQRATGTTEADWEVQKTSAQAYIDEGFGRVRNGDLFGVVNVLYGYHFKEGYGGDFETERGTVNAAIGLAKDDLDAEVKAVVAEMLKNKGE